MNRETFGQPILYYFWRLVGKKQHSQENYEIKSLEIKYLGAVF